jgi:hypothetical protein
MRNWKITGVVALVVIVVIIPMFALRQMHEQKVEQPSVDTPSTFVGRGECIDCHTEAYESWLGSDHDNAMDHANEHTMRGDFNDSEFTFDGVTSRFYTRDDKYYIHTQGPDGESAEFEVLYTFGIEPLQQYLIPFPGGRLQAFSIGWDTEEERWFHLYQDYDIPPVGDWLHWTRNGQNWNGMCAECHSQDQRNRQSRTCRSLRTLSFATTGDW